MKRSLPLPRSTRWFTSAAAGLITLAPAEQLTTARPDVSEAIRRVAQPQRFIGGWEGVLGTSLDLVIESARATDAVECAARVLAEIERLRRLLSTYDPASEIRRVMAGARVESVELAELLALYETWAGRTGGLIDINLGGVIAAWREATHTGRPPSEVELTSAATRSRAWNVDALGKGFIIERAVAIARRIAPGGLLDLGGDIRAWGETVWRIGVADPANPADNAPPLAQLTLREAAVATSGGYARFHTVGSERYSHLINPRTHRPLAVVGSATVVAADSVTANALALATSGGGAERGSALAAAHGATGYLFTDRAGGFTSGGTLTATAAAPAETPAPSAWPAGFQVTMQVALKKHTGPRELYRPQVAVWIENAEGRIIRAITVWGLSGAGAPGSRRGAIKPNTCGGAPSRRSRARRVQPAAIR